MPDTTSLVLNVKSDSVVKSAKALEKLESAAKKTDNTVSLFNKETGKLESVQKKTTRSTNALRTGVLDLDKGMSKAEASASALAKDSNTLVSKQTKLIDTTGRLTDLTGDLANQQRVAGRRTKDLEDDVENLNRDLERSGTSSRAAGDGLSSLTGKVAKLGAAYLSVRTVIAGTKFALTASANMETLETSFVSLTGSAEEAKKQVQILTSFTASTPFRLEGVSTAARQLITAKGSVEGLTEQLQVLGDISSAANVPIQELAAIYTKAFNKGKIQAEELNQISDRGIPIIAALAEQMGVTREEVFELGSEGKIAFTDLEIAFKKFTQEGGFAFEAMIKQSETLNGRFSTLGDSALDLGAKIGTGLSELVNLNGILDSLTGGFKVWGDLIQGQAATLFQRTESAETLEQIERAILQTKGETLRLEEQGLANLSESEQKEHELLLRAQKRLEIKFKEIDINERNTFFLEREREELQKQASWLSRLREENSRLTDEENFRLDAMENQIKILDIQIAQSQELIDTVSQPIPKINEILSADFNDVESSLRTQGEVINDQFNDRKNAIIAYQGALESVADLTAEQVDRIDNALKRAESARQTALASVSIAEGGHKTDFVPLFMKGFPERPKPKKTRKRTTPRRATRSRRSSTSSRRSSTPSRSSSLSRSIAPSRSDAQREFDSLKESLEREEQAIETSYLRRVELIRANTKEGSAIRTQLESQITEKYQGDLDEFRQKTVSELDITKTGYTLQLDELDAFYAKRKQAILDATAITEGEKTTLVLALTEERASVVAALEKEKNAQQLAIADDFFGGIAQLSSSHSSKVSKIGKAAAVAQTTIKTYESATSAYAAMAGIPVVGPALGAAAAAAAIGAGLANVSAIQSQSAGNFASGGIVGGNSFSGDAMTANVNSGELVLNLEQQKRLLNIANGASAGVGVGSGGNLNITVLPTSGTTADIKQDPNNPQNIEIILRKVDEKLTSDLQTGDGQFIPALTTRVPALRQA